MYLFVGFVFGFVTTALVVLLIIFVNRRKTRRHQATGKVGNIYHSLYGYWRVILINIFFYVFKTRVQTACGLDHNNRGKNNHNLKLKLVFIYFESCSYIHILNCPPITIVYFQDNHRDSGDLHYASINVESSSRSQKQRKSSQSVRLYSSVKNEK